MSLYMQAVGVTLLVVEGFLFNQAPLARLVVMGPILRSGCHVASALVQSFLAASSS